MESKISGKWKLTENKDISSVYLKAGVKPFVVNTLNSHRKSGLIKETIYTISLKENCINVNVRINGIQDEDWSIPLDKNIQVITSVGEIIIKSAKEIENNLEYILEDKRNNKILKTHLKLVDGKLHSTLSSGGKEVTLIYERENIGFI